MDSLAGELTTMEIGEVLTLIGSKRLTGQLLVEDEPLRKSFFIQDGQLIQSASNQERESFGQLLCQFGSITPAQLERAMESKFQEQTLLGVQLVRLGFMTEEDVCQSLVVKMRETLLDIVQWQGGAFRFLRGVLPSDRPALEVSVEVNSLLPEVEFRKTAWETIRQIFSSEQLSFVVHEDRLPRSLVPGSLDDRLFQQMREGCTLAELSQSLYSSRFFLHQKLYALYRQGAIELGPERRPDAPMLVGESMDDTSQMLILARGFIQSGSFAQAELIAARAIEISPSPEAQQLLAEAEAAHLTALQQRILEPNPAPCMSRGMPDLKNLALSPQEKYLLSRIDGVRTVRSLLRITPMREFDALKCIEHFVEAGYIELPVAMP